MSKTEEQEMPTTFPKKWAKLIKDMPEFRDTADSSSVEDLKKIIVMSEGNIFNVEKAKEDDVKLNAAKELVKDLGSGYSEAIKNQRCKIAYALFLMEGKGTDLGDSDTE